MVFSSKGKNKKMHQVEKSLVHLVLGDNVKTKEIIDISLKALVGWCMGEVNLRGCLKDSWEPILSYLLRYFVLV
jgi:hypothetical protein